MAVWRADLTLRLEDDVVIVTRDNQDPTFFHAPNYENHVAGVSGPLLEAMNVALDGKANDKERQRAEREVRRLGLELFEGVFGVADGSGNRLEDTLRSILEMQGGHPPTIGIEGQWYLLPWELMRVPTEVSLRAQEAYLGELSIVAGLVGPQRLGLTMDYEIEDKLQLVSIVGDQLKFVSDEIGHINQLNGPNLHPIRLVRGLRGGRSVERRSQNCEIIGQLLRGPVPANFLHGAFHSSTPAAGDAFEIHIEKRATLTSNDCRQFRLRVDEPNIAFFNSCQGISMNRWRAGGLALHAVTRWNSEVVVTSLCKIDDEQAAAFSQRFLDRILPVNGTIAEPIGLALYHERCRTLTEQGPTKLLGLSYRLLGCPARRFSMPNEMAA